MPRSGLTITVDRNTQRDVARALAGVKLGVQNRVVKAAMAKAARAAAKASKRLAPVGDSGRLKRSIGVRFKSRPKSGRWEYKTGPRRGFAGSAGGRKRDPVRYAHLAEFGRKAVVPTKKKALFLKPLGVVRKRAGAAAGRPFVTPVWEGLRLTAPRRIAADVKAGVAREAAKYKARGKSIYG